MVLIPPVTALVLSVLPVPLLQGEQPLSCTALAVPVSNCLPECEVPEWRAAFSWISSSIQDQSFAKGTDLQMVAEMQVLDFFALSA